MKQINSLGKLAVVQPGIRHGMSNRLRIRPPCFAEVYRRCSQQDLFWKFGDGSIYHYLPDSIAAAVAVAESVKKGYLFNSDFRQDGVTKYNFERVTSVPSDAELIDWFPPYVARIVPPCSSWDFVLHGNATFDGGSSTFEGSIFPGTSIPGDYTGHSPNYHFDATANLHLDVSINWTGQWTPDTRARFAFGGLFQLEPPLAPVYGPVEFHGDISVPPGDYTFGAESYDLFFRNKTIGISAAWTFS